MMKIIMSKKSFLIILTLLTLFMTACQSSPTTTVPNNSGPTPDVPNKPKETNQPVVNLSEMNHSEMKSAPNAAKEPFDLQFLDTMSEHHKSAVVMANIALTKAENAELKTFAQKIIADQSEEITQMKQWRDKWFADKPAALNLEMSGMSDSMKGMNMKAFDSLSGKAFDLEFIKQMTAHHKGAVTMAKAALTKAEHLEIKSMAQGIITAQEAEIEQMQTWQKAWGK